MVLACLLAGLVLSLYPIYATPVVTGSNISWIDCLTVIPDEIRQANDSITSIPPTLRCGNLNVPLDHSKPCSDNNSVTIHFAIGGDPKARRLLNANPGGPLAPATPFAWYYGLPTSGAALFTGLAPDYAILGMDTRGSGFSTSLECDAGTFASLIGLSARNENEWNFQANVVKNTTANCGPLLQHMTSNDTVRDYELLRQALGYDKVSYFGFSYGTRFGSDYVRLFPESLENVVLDGILSPGIPAQELVSASMADSARLIDRADAFCMVDTQCPFHGQGKGAVANAFKQVLARADNGNLSNITGDIVRLATVVAFLPSRPDFPAFAEVLSLALNNDTSGFDALTAPSQVKPILPWATFCPDLPYYPTYQEYAKILEATHKLDRYNLTASGSALVLSVCNAWPVKGSTPQAYVDFPKHVLLVQSDYDYNTPAENAFGVFKNAKNSTLVMRHGDSHGTFFVAGPARDAIFAHINNGTLPDVVDNALITIYTHGNSTAEPSVPDPYNTILGDAAGDFSTIRSITFSAANSTSDPVPVPQTNKNSRHRYGGVDSGASVFYSSTALVAVIVTITLMS